MFQKAEARRMLDTGLLIMGAATAMRGGGRSPLRAVRNKQAQSNWFRTPLPRGFFIWRNWMPKWRSEYRRCDNCRSEYRPKREVQSYCSRDCRRAAAYGRERFKAGTVGRRRRRLEASDNVPDRVLAGSVRSGPFSSIEPIPCKAIKPPILPVSTTGLDARSVIVGSCCREIIFRVTCSASRCAKELVASNRRYRERNAA